MKQEIAEIISNQTGLDSSEILPQIEIPPDESLGDYSFPCFILSKKEKKAPKIKAEELVKKL